MADTIEIVQGTATVVEVAGPTGPQGPAGAAGATGAQGPQGVPGTGLEVLTTQGDILYQGASAGQRLPIGATGQILKVAGGIPSWANESGAVTSVNGATGAVVVAAATHAVEHEAGEADEIQAMAALVDTNVIGLNGVYFFDGTLTSGRPNFFKTGTRKNTKLQYVSSTNEWNLVRNTVVEAIGWGGDATRPWTVNNWADDRDPAVVETITVARLGLEDMVQKLAETGSAATATTSQDGLLSASDQQKLNGIASGAEVNVQSNWTEADSGNDAFILNKPSTFAPSAHSSSHASSGSDPLFDQDLNTTDSVAFEALDVQSQLTVYGSVDFSPASSVLLPPISESLSIQEQAGNINGTFRAEPDSLTANRTYDLPDASGTLALTSDIPANTIASTIVDAKGDLIVATAADTVARLPVGATNGHVLTVDSAEAGGMKWAAASGGGVTGAAASASDVLGVSGSDITGVDANADRIVYWNNTANKLAYGTPADAGAAAASHTHAASDVTSGTFDNARINFAAPAAIGGTTPSTGAFTSLSTAPAANTAAFTTTGYSLTGSNAQSLVDLAGTWNTTGTPSAIKLNITDTASNASSLLMQLQTGGTNRLTINKSGDAFGRRFGTSVYYYSAESGFGSLYAGGVEVMAATNNASVGVCVNSTYSIGFATSVSSAAADVRMWRDAAATWALRDGVTAQEARVYGTFTSSTNYQRMTIKSVKQTLSALSGASATTTGTFIPDGAVVVGVTTRVATALTGAAGYTIGDGTDADRWGDITGTAIGTTSDNRDWTAGTIECFTAGGEITLTAKTSNFTAGAIEICVFYLAGQAD